MESPTTSKIKAETTPKHQKKSPLNRGSNAKHLQKEFSRYGLHRESSPVGFGCSQDLEIGWGDSPEPMTAEKKLTYNTTPVHHKKKLELKESPRSTGSFKNRKPRSCFPIPQKSTADIAKYVAEVKELSKNIMKEICDQEDEPPERKNLPETNDLSKYLPEDDSINEDLIACTQSIERKLEETKKCETPKESSFDKVIQSFLNEEDDWMSSVIINMEPKQTPRKGNFVKSRSDNQLESPRVQTKKPTSFSQTKTPTSFSQSKTPTSLARTKPPTSLIKTINNNCANSNNNNNVKSSTNFRRTNSFDSPKTNLNVELRQDFRHSLDSNPPLKRQKSFSFCANPIQYSQEEIERKRLEAECRKKKREIERKRLEAVKKLEMKKKNNGINVSRQASCVASK